jgi:hypothetical protein
LPRVVFEALACVATPVAATAPPVIAKTSATSATTIDGVILIWDLGIEIRSSKLLFGTAANPSGPTATLAHGPAVVRARLGI